MKKNSQHVTDHLANERTYLAWIRTNLGIMAFGFVVEKFSFFIQQIAIFLGKTEGAEAGRVPSSFQGYSSGFGISLVGIGALLCIFAFLKYKKSERQINEEAYKPSMILDTLLMLLVVFIGVFLLIYLISSHTALSHK